MGYPIAEEVCGKRDGGCSQEFEHGTLYWSPASGTHAVMGALRDAYRAQGGENGKLGYPIAEQVGGGPYTQQFQGGTLRR